MHPERLQDFQWRRVGDWERWVVLLVLLWEKLGLSHHAITSYRPKQSQCGVVGAHLHREGYVYLIVRHASCTSQVLLVETGTGGGWMAPFESPWQFLKPMPPVSVASCKLMPFSVVLLWPTFNQQYTPTSLLGMHLSLLLHGLPVYASKHILLVPKWLSLRPKSESIVIT